MEEDCQNTLQEVFAGTMWEVGLVRSILSDCDIISFVRDEIRGLYDPWVVAAGGIGAIKIMVSSNDYHKAMAIIDEYNENQKHIE